MRPTSALRSTITLAVGCALVTSLAATSSVSGQAFHTYVYTDLDGLPSAKVYDIHQSADRVMWFGTRLGLVSFDGLRWKTHTHPPDMPAEFCIQIEIDDEGSVWAVPESLNAGVSVLTEGAWRHVPPPAGLLAPATIVGMRLVESPLGRIALATSKSVFVWNGSGWRRFGTSDGIDHVFGIAPDGDRLLVATGDGYRTVDGSGVSRPDVGLDLPPGSVVGIAVERRTAGDARIWLQGRRWLGFVEDSRFRMLVDGSRHPDATADSRTATILEPDGGGGLFFGNHGGLWHYSPVTDAIRQVGVTEGLGSEATSCLYTDIEKNLWVGNHRGANRIPSPRFLSYRSDQGLLDDEVSAIAEFPEGRIVFGQRNGLSFLEGGRIDPMRLAEPGSTAVNFGKILELCSDGDGNLWIAASRRGVARLDAKGGIEWYEHENPVSSATGILVDARNQLWVSCVVDVCTIEDGRYVDIAIPGLVDPRRVMEGKSGAIYVASATSGLFARDPDDLTWTHYRHASNRAANNVYATLEDDELGTLVGTAGGLCRITGSELIEETRVVIGDPVYFVLRDASGNLWCGTDKGVVKWDGTKRRYTVHQGLAGQETNRAAGFVDSRGTLWIGTNRGVSMYQEQFDDVNVDPPTIDRLDALCGEEPVAITGYSGGSEIDLGRAGVTFRFRAISFLGNGIVRYRCQLVGFDDDWLPESASREIRYTALPEGSYSFRVQACDSEGRWGPPAESTALVVHGPFWQRGWFFVLCGIAVACIGAIVSSMVLARRRSDQLQAALRRRSEELRESERRYRETFEKNWAAELSVEPDAGNILDANPAACTLFGRSAEELRAGTFYELTTLPRHKVADHLRRSDSAAGNQFSLPYRRTDGEPGTLKVYAFALDLHGRRTLQLTLHDSTNQLRLEEELRTAQKLTALGQLAGGVAHDFNNLLTAIIGFSDMAGSKLGKGRPIDTEISEISKAGRRGANLVRQLLAFSRRQEMNREALCLNDVISETLGLVRSVVGKGIDVIPHFDDDTGTIVADRGQVEQVVMNLSINARDAMPDGGELRILTHRSENLPHGIPATDGAVPNGSYAVLEVQDTGTGIPPDIQSRIFEPFFTTKDVDRGTGLGLPTVYGIVRQSGGHIFVDSEEDHGSTFWVYFPRENPDRDAVASDSSQ